MNNRRILKMTQSTIFSFFLLPISVLAAGGTDEHETKHSFHPNVIGLFLVVPVKTDGIPILLSVSNTSDALVNHLEWVASLSALSVTTTSGCSPCLSPITQGRGNGTWHREWKTRTTTKMSFLSG